MGTTPAAKGLIAGLLVLAAQPSAASCDENQRLHALDFWLGRWTVSWNGEEVGRNVIEPILDGCAVTEHWTDAQGHDGFSLFYFDRHTDRWKQVWVTDNSLRTRGTKEKTEARELTTGSSIRFEGRYPGDKPGIVILDRTTLTRHAGGRVRQLIEVSTDGGQTWNTTFDGEYRRVD